MKMQEVTKKIMAGILVTATVLTGTLLSASEAKAATSYEYEDKIVYTNEVENAVSLYNSDTAPTKAGYVFGGWFTDDTGATQVTDESVSEGAALYAKFVPAYVLSVKAQNHQDVATAQKIRLISGVDNEAHYQNVGFKVYFGNKTDDGYVKTAEGDQVYSKIIVNKTADTKDEYVATEVFGTYANYFNIAEVTGIQEKSFASIIYVKPYWVTNDGTTVYGLGKYVSVQDGIDGIISIPVNLCTAKAIAAGRVELTYPEYLEYLGDEDGYKAGSRLLSEMAVKADTTNRKIKCAGNVADVDAALSADTDLYVSLRFKVADAYKEKITVAKDRLNFTITKTEFCDWAEADVPMSDYVWDIQY